MPDLGKAREGGYVIYSEIEIGKVSELEVKWHCFAERVALQNGQYARGSSLEAAWNLPTHPNSGHTAAVSLRKPSLDPGISFPVIEGCTGSRKVAAK